MENEKNEITRLEEWRILTEKMEDFLYDDNGIYTTALFDPGLKTYNIDFDVVKELLQDLKNFEKKYGELYKDEKKYLWLLKNKLLEVDNEENHIKQICEKFSNIYEFIEDY